MRIDTEQRTFETSIDAAPTAFQIQATAKAFQILSNQLYTKKALAIVRELTANAIDAHVAARTTDIPFKIHLPTTLEPWFEINDYGTGLSDSAIRKLYCTYFASNKTDTDELIGGFGLGSKSPFAYTDQFIVESRYDGVKRKYSIHIAANGTPQIMEVEAVSTAEPSGLTVSVGVAMKDINDFHEAAGNVLPYVTACRYESNVTFNAPEYSLRVDLPNGAYFCMRKGATRNWPTHVIQGSVRYIVDDQALSNDWVPGIDIYVPIGTLEVTASREHLSLNDTTRDWFNTTGVLVRDQIKEKIKIDLSQFTTIVERTSYLRELSGWDHPLQAFIKEDMYDPIELPPSVSVYGLRHAHTSRRRKSWFELNTIHCNTNDSGWRKALTRMVCEKAAKRVWWAEKKSWVKPYIMERQKAGHDNLEGLVVIGNEDGVFEFLEQLGIEENNATRIPKPPKKARTAASRTMMSGMYSTITPDIAGGWMQTNLNDMIEDDNIDRIIIVNREEMESHAIQQFLYRLRNVGIRFDSGTRLVFVPPSHTKVRNALLQMDGIEEWNVNVRQPIPDAIDVLGLDRQAMIDIALTVEQGRINYHAVGIYRGSPLANSHHTDYSGLRIAIPDVVSVLKKIEASTATISWNDPRGLFTQEYWDRGPTICTLAEKQHYKEARLEKAPFRAELDAIEKKYGGWMLLFMKEGYDITALRLAETILKQQAEIHNLQELLKCNTPISSPEPHSPSLLAA